MCSRNLMVGIVILFTGCYSCSLHAQCFASSGNPVGGSANLGVMNRQALRTMTFYRYHFASRYFEGDQIYHGNARIYSSANYNYAGLLLGYGITNQITAEMETGYYINKTVFYQKTNYSNSGYGLSNALLSMKYAFYHDPDERFEVAGAAGVNLPYRQKLQRADNVTLPYDAQPSTLSYGLVLQSYVIKENSFKSIRFFWVNRYEYNLKNPYDVVFGDVLSSGFFFSRHFVFGQGKFKDWTLILQLRYQHINPNKGYKDEASGGSMVLAAPQVNCSFNETWNISLLWEKPVYQYYNGIQLGENYALLVNIARDFNLAKKPVTP